MCYDQAMVRDPRRQADGLGISGRGYQLGVPSIWGGEGQPRLDHEPRFQHNDWEKATIVGDGKIPGSRRSITVTIGVHAGTIPLSFTFPTVAN